MVKIQEAKTLEKLECNLCKETAWKGPQCNSCDLNNVRHYCEGRGEGPANFFVIAASPNLSGPSGITNQHSAWSIGIEKMIRDTIDHVRNLKYRDNYLNGCYTYAVRCEEEKPKKKQIDACYPLLESYLIDNATPNKPIVILAVGKEILQSLKIPVNRYKSLQGAVLTTRIKNRQAYVIPTTSKRQLLAKSGFFQVLDQHIIQMLRIASEIKNGKYISPELRKANIEKNYHYVQTINELERLTNIITEYHTKRTSPENHYISIDTETNTLNPHRKKLKLVTFVVAWDRGHVMSLPVEHKDSPFTLEEVRPYINEILRCRKPKIFQNAKYDLKVLTKKGFTVVRLAWDTMLGEHLLVEDKAGYYSLKQQTKDYLPTYAGYENELKKIQNEITAKQGEKSKKEKLKGAAKKLAEDDGYINLPLPVLNKYGCIDGDVTLRLFHMQYKRMKQEETELNIKRNRKKKQTNGSLRFKHIYQTSCPHNNPLENLMFTRAIPVTKTLADMELKGFAVDQEYTNKLAETMDLSLIDLSTKLNSMIFPGSFDKKTPFNPNSSAHLIKTLFTLGFVHPDTKEIISYHSRIDKNAIPRTEKGAISLNANFLRYIKNQFECPFATTLLDYRAIMKARSTFVENIRVMSAEDGCMHTTFHIPGTATGRLSSSGENMQNIPAWILIHNIKKMFIPRHRSSYVIINSDAKAAEVRIYAAYSKDKNLITALNDGMDPHSFFASTVYKPESVLSSTSGSEKKALLSTIGIDEEHSWSYEDFQNRDEILKTDKNYGKQLNKLRKNIKRVVFGMLYGANEHKIGSIVGIPDEQAKAIINVLFKMFPTIKQYINNTHDQVEHLGMVETFLGRRRRFSGYQNMPFGLKNRAKRQAVNFKIQSTSSDIVLDVLCSLAGPINRDLNGQLLITVHDSVVFEIPKHYVSQMPDLMQEYGVKQVAEKYPWLPVPFQWDVEVGPSYGELQSVPSYLTKHPDIIQNTDYEELEIREALKAV